MAHLQALMRSATRVSGGSLMSGTRFGDHDWGESNVWETMTGLGDHD